MPGVHARLSPSGAHTWLYCTRAPRMQQGIPEEPSPYAAAGTLAHSMAELKARKYFMAPMSARTFNSRIKKLKESPHYERGMDKATDDYLDYLKSIVIASGDTKPFVALEARVDYGEYVPGGYGRADCLIFAPPALYVVDFKNGAGVPVDAEWNPQMMLYGLGALCTFKEVYGNSIEAVAFAIVQPNAGGVKEWGLPRAELEEWGDHFVRPRAWLAERGQGDFAPSESRCRFCRAKAICKARANYYLSLSAYQSQTDDGTLTNAQIGQILPRAEGLTSWVSDIKDYTLKTILAGGSVPGYKVVEGRSARAWADTDKAFEALQAKGISEAVLWERKPVSPPALEKALGKADFAKVADGLVAKKPGKPTLVPESDKRQPYNAAQIAFGGDQND